MERILKIKPRKIKILSAVPSSPYYDIGARRDRRFSPNFYNISIAWGASKYTRIFDSRLELGERKQLRIDRAEWSKPMNDLLADQQPLLKSKTDIIKTTSDGSILYLNFASHTLNPNGTFGEAVLQVCSFVKNPLF